MDSNASSAARERSPDSQPLDFRTRAKLIRDDAALTHHERAVLSAINAFVRGDAEWCWPSLRRLAAKAGMSWRGVQQIVRRLEGVGLVEVQSSRDPRTDRCRPNHLRIDWTSVRAHAVQGRTPCGGEGARRAGYEGARRAGGRAHGVQGGQHLTSLRVVSPDDDAPRAGKNSLLSNTHKAPAAGVCVGKAKEPEPGVRGFLARFYADLARADGPLFVPAPTAQEIEVAEEVLRQLGPDAALAAIPRVLDRVRRQWPDCRRFAGTVSFWNDVIAADRRRRDAAVRQAEAVTNAAAAAERAAADVALRDRLRQDFERLSPSERAALDERAVARHPRLAKSPAERAIVAFLLFIESGAAQPEPSS